MRGAPKKLVQPISPETVTAAIFRLSGLPLNELRAAWSAEFHREQPKGLSRDLLTRMLVWRLQEEAFGGHDAATLKLLKAFAGQDADKLVLFRKLKPGTTVVREYQGVRHIVTITEGGFVWEGRTYSSLSAIALAITGAKWNGPRFFGLRDPNTGRPARKAS
jgi:hypothetical protein